MKKNKLNMVVAIALCVSLGLSSCIGSFKLTNKVLGWNEGVGNKFVNELVFIAFHIIPVYELTVVADILVLNSIEFWSGENLVSQSTKEVKDIFQNSRLSLNTLFQRNFFQNQNQMIPKFLYRWNMHHLIGRMNSPQCRTK